MIVKYLLVIISFYLLCVDCSISYSKGGARLRFTDKFHKTCSKYSFVDKYLANLRNPSSDYLIFVFHEAGQRNHGGLGDRVAGIVTAFAYAIRSQRTFLMQGDPAFEDAFQPYFPPDTSKEDSQKYSWRSWDWAKWDRQYSANMTNLHCINPRPGWQHCALDNHHSKKYKVIKYYGNRCYLCRWLIKPSLGLRAELAESLGISAASDLYEVAGCMLRLAMWPTEQLWDALDESLQGQFSHIPHLSNKLSAPNSNAASGEVYVKTSKQVGFHFRCGDVSFNENSGAPPNPECYYDVSGKLPWKGTRFSDDFSMESPLDEAQCGLEVLQQSLVDSNSAGSVLAYIASDNPVSANQINSTLAWNFTIKPPDACHIDMAANARCTLTTSLHWFMLSLSDVMVVQALIKSEDSIYTANSPETAHLVDTESAPISAFSRYAAIYSLSPNSIRYGRGCHQVNTTALSYQTHGNWACDSKLFF